MNRRWYFTSFFITITLILTACSLKNPNMAGRPATLPNPASVYCTQHGGNLQIITAPDGSQSGQCNFPDASSCDEWTYYRGECSPHQPSSTPNQPTFTPDQPSNLENMPNPAAGFCEQHGGRNRIVTASDGSQSGQCDFPDGSSCDEWAYFNGKYAPEGLVPTPITSPAVIDHSNPEAVLLGYFDAWRRGDWAALDSCMGQNYGGIAPEPLDSLQIQTIQRLGTCSATQCTYMASFDIVVKGTGVSMSSGHIMWSYYLSKDEKTGYWYITNYGAG